MRAAFLAQMRLETSTFSMRRILRDTYKYLSSLKTNPVSQIDFWGRKCSLPQKWPNNPTFAAKPPVDRINCAYENEKAI